MDSKVNKNHVSKRKKLKKEAARSLGVSIDALGWVNGELVFLASNTRVDGIAKVPKPAAPVVVKPASHVDDYDWRQRQSRW